MDCLEIWLQSLGHSLQGGPSLWAALVLCWLRQGRALLGCVRARSLLLLAACGPAGLRQRSLEVCSHPRLALHTYAVPALAGLLCQCKHCFKWAITFAFMLTCNLIQTCLERPF